MAKKRAKKRHGKKGKPTLLGKCSHSCKGKGKGHKSCVRSCMLTSRKTQRG